MTVSWLFFNVKMITLEKILSDKKPNLIGQVQVNVTANQTGSVTLNCDAENADSYSWKKDGETVTISSSEFDMAFK